MRTIETLAPAGGRSAGPLALFRANPTLIPALAAVAILVALGGSEAGFYPTSTGQHPGLGWYPAAVFLLALLVASVIAVPPPRPVPRVVVAALVLLAGFTAWSYLSIAWAEQQGVAWDGANRTALYLLVFALFALWPLTARAGMLLLGALGLGIAGLGFVELLKANASSEPLLYFIGARFAEPAGYINANVALWTIGLWPCLYLASEREVNPVLRGLALGGAGLLGGLALMGQSRGWVFALPLAALLFVALMPSRARALAAVGAIAVGVFLARGPLLAVHDSFTEQGFDGLLADATTAILVLAAALTVVGLLAALVDRRVQATGSQTRTADRAAIAAVGILLLAGGLAAVIAVGNPVTEISDSWETFKDVGEAEDAGSSRFSTVGSNRYDFWTVAWDLFREDPLTGIGSENFQQDYLVQGKSTEQPRYPHSLELGVLSQTGLVGALLLGGALLAAGLAALAARRGSGRETAAVAGAGGALFAYWLLHASVDWFWEFPALTASAFAALGLAGAVGRRKRSTKGAPDRLQRRLKAIAMRVPALPRALGPVLAALAGGLLALSLIAPWLAEREIERAISSWPASTTAAYERLERAESLNPLSPMPHLVAATIAVRTEDEERALRELEEVLKMEPRTSFALAELAALASERGDQAESERLLRRASAYAPRDQVVAGALQQLLSGELIDIRRLNASYLRKARSRVGRK